MIGRFILLYRMIVSGFTTSAVAILLIPVIGRLPEERQDIAGYVVAALFWIGLIMGLVMTYMTGGSRYELRNKMPELRRIRPQLYPGIINFEKSATHITVYIAFVLGIAMIVCDVLGTPLPQSGSGVMYVIIALTYYSFLLHCLIDGENYKIYKFLKKGY